MTTEQRPRASRGSTAVAVLVLIGGLGLAVQSSCAGTENKPRKDLGNQPLQPVNQPPQPQPQPDPQPQPPPPEPYPQPPT